MPDPKHDRLQSLQFAVLGGIASGLVAIAADVVAPAIAPLPAITPLSPTLFPSFVAHGIDHLGEIFA